MYKAKEGVVGEQVLRNFEKSVMLQSLDNLWKEHLAAMDHLRQGIHLRGYAQKDPKQEYKRESFELFEGLLDTLKLDVVTILSRVRVQDQEEVWKNDERTLENNRGVDGKREKIGEDTKWERWMLLGDRVDEGECVGQRKGSRVDDVRWMSGGGRGWEGRGYGHKGKGRNGFRDFFP